ncbi:c-type cytochrome [Phycisphaeraceae bacterium D3-23]
MNTLLPNLLATTTRTVKPETLLFPENAATDTSVDSLFYFIFWVSAFFLVLNAGLMIYFAMRYRQRSKEGAAHGHTHNTAMEVTWSVIPAFILAIIFIWGFRGFLRMANPPNIDPQHEIAVTGSQWKWDFTYPNGEQVMGSGTDMAALHVPAGVPVRLSMRSTDVLHSVFIPAFRVKQDVVPGRVTQLWFEPIYDPDGDTVELSVPNPENENEVIKLYPNVYDFYCTEYCGTDHSRMVTKVYVYPPDQYAQWYEAMTIIGPGKNMIELGSELYAQQCTSCHTVDGGAGTGPTWLNFYGSTSSTNAGDKLVNDDYIIESIRNPGLVIANKPDGSSFGNNMSASFGGLTDRQVRALIEYMKSISEHGNADETLVYGDFNPNGTLKAEEDADAGDGDPEGGADAE